MVQTRSGKNTTDTNIEVNRDVAEASNKNTMYQKKRKTTTAENSIMKPIEASKKTTKKGVNARDAGTSKKSKSKSVVGAYKGKLTERKPTKKGLALDMFLVEYKREYVKKHPGVKWLPDEEVKAGRKKFDELVKTTKSKIVEEYFEKFQYARAGIDVSENTYKNSIMKPIEASKKTTKKVVNARDAGTSKKSKSSSEKSKSVVGAYEGKLTERPITEEDLALDMFLLEYKREYVKKHPGVKWLPAEEVTAGHKKFYQLVKTTKSKIVEEYLEKYQFAEVGMHVTKKYLLGKRSHPLPFDV